MSDVIPATDELLNYSNGVGKQVNLTPGMVVRAADFTRMRRYPVEKLIQHNASLHGYGTVRGLKVTPAPDKNPQSQLADVKISVETGMGIDRLGFAFTIRETQCAYLGDWLEKHQADVQRTKSSDGGTIYVLARYLPVYADTLPLADASCWNGTDGNAYSRIEDSFELQLTLDEPSMPVWQASQRFRQLMSHVEIGNGNDELELKNAVGKLGTPVDPPAKLVLQAASFSRVLEDINLMWVDEVLPDVVSEEKDSAGYPHILLAAIPYEIDGDRPVYRDARKKGAVAAEALNRVEERPYLLHTQLFQHMPWDHVVNDVAHALEADHASSADQAKRAEFAAAADIAKEAAHASNADRAAVAEHASNADYASKAEYARNADDAKRADFAAAADIAKEAAHAQTADRILTVPIPLVTITPASKPEANGQLSFELWFHLDTFPKASPDTYLDEASLQVTVLAETGQQTRALVTLGGHRLTTGVNTFSITTTFDSAVVNASNVSNFIFVIPLATLKLKDSLRARTLKKFDTRFASPYFEGQTVDAENHPVVIAYVRNPFFVTGDVN